MEDYMSGVYDQECRACGGTGKMKESQIEKLREAADDRRLAALENGDWEAYQSANDYRYGS
jgi:hypothetical protein